MLQRVLPISFARWQHPILSEALPSSPEMLPPLPLTLPLIRWQQLINRNSSTLSGGQRAHWVL